MGKITLIEQSKKLPKLLRVAAYARVSRNKESLIHSFNNQVEYYRSYIKSNKDYIFKGVYADLGISGTKEDREQFNKLLEECRKGEIDLILTKSISRFARNTATLLKTIRELKSLHVDVYFEEQNIHSISEEGELILTLLASMAQEEARDMSENVKWAILKKFSEGKVYTMTILGYRIKDGVLVVEPSEAETVKEIYSLYLKGYGPNLIAKLLRQKGCKSRYGVEMTSTTVHWILRNPTYTGDLILQTTYRENFITKKTLKNKGQKRMWKVEEAHEPIIDKETFALVQEEIKARTSNPTTRSEANPFRLKVMCPYCHRHFLRKYDRGKFHYVCGKYDRYGIEGCPNRKIPLSLLEKVTAEALEIGTFDEEIFLRKIDHLEVYNDFKMIFYFKSGRVVEKEWHYPSRKESWTPEMKAEMSKKIKLANERRKLCQESQLLSQQ